MSTPTEDSALLRDTARAALRDLSPIAEVRRLMETGEGRSSQTWYRLCRELGIAGLAVPEEHGGSGFGEIELGVVFEEAGRALLCAPLLATAGLAIPLLLAVGDVAAMDRYLPGLCGGSLVATVVTAGQTGGPAAPEAPAESSVTEHPGVTAVPGDDGWRLSGSASFVLDGAHADVVFVPALTDGSLALFAVESGAAGLGVVPLITLDQTRKQAQLRLDAVRAVRLETADPEAALSRALNVGRAMLACEQAGGAGRCLELTVEHAKSRIQFGRPIGSFQAVKQHAADMLIKVESARSAAGAAARAAADRDGGEDLAVVAAVAKAYCSEAYVAVAGETIQLHGGIGFTWEHDAHLYFKRAWASAEMLGKPAELLERVGAHLATAL
jgi:acyl-CoA dehydrogenase